MGGFAGLTDKRFGRPFWFLPFFRPFFAGGLLALRTPSAFIWVASVRARRAVALAVPRGVGTANCGDLPLFASLCRLRWPFMEMKMGATRHFSTEQSQFLVSHLLSYCPARFEHVQSEPASESPEEANSLASRPKA